MIQNFMKKTVRSEFISSATSQADSGSIQASALVFSGPNPVSTPNGTDLSQTMYIFLWR